MRIVELVIEVPGRTAIEAYDALADLERYPDLAEAVNSVEVTRVADDLTRSAWEVRFRNGLLRWVEEDAFDRRERTITFRQLEGDVAVFDGSWRCLDHGVDARIVFRARLDMGIPSLADALEPIAARTLVENTVDIVSGLLSGAVLRRVGRDRADRDGGGLMALMTRERETLDRFLPGLDKYLADRPLEELEAPGNGALEAFRDAGGPALMVPTELGGKGASLVEAVRIQRAVGSRSPSLAVASTMHHFSVASLVELTAVGEGFEWAMLTAIAEQQWLLSSGFAEGRPGQHILSPGMRGTAVDGGLLVNGTKRPCSLTWSMHLMSASVAVTDPDGGPDLLAIVLVPAESDGIERTRFWQSPALTGAESDQVTLTDVLVPEALVFYPADGDHMDPIQARGFVWFELLVSASYLGAATRLAERVLGEQRGTPHDRADLAIELETAMAALEEVARSAETDRGRRRGPGPGAVRPLCHRAHHRARRHGRLGDRRRDGLHRQWRGGLPPGGHPRPGLPPTLARGRRRPTRGVPRRRTAGPVGDEEPWTPTTCSSPARRRTGCVRSTPWHWPSASCWRSCTSARSGGCPSSGSSSPSTWSATSPVRSRSAGRETAGSPSPTTGSTT